MFCQLGYPCLSLRQNSSTDSKPPLLVIHSDAPHMCTHVHTCVHMCIHVYMHKCTYTHTSTLEGVDCCCPVGNVENERVN